jgi:hypothetical protein
LILKLSRGILEGVVDFAESMFQDIRETNQDRQVDSPRLELVHELFKINGMVRSLVGMNGDVSFLGN